MLFSEEPEYEGNNYGNNDASDQGEIECKVFTLKVDVAGKPAQPGEFTCKGQDDAHRCNHHPQHYQYRVELNCRHDFETFSFDSSSVTEAHLSDDPNTEFIDAALLGKELVLRNWREGDWFVPFGMQERKKVSDFFIDTKVSHLEKSSIPLFVSDDQIVWICGKRLDNRFRISPQTRSIVKLEYLPRSFAG